MRHARRAAIFVALIAMITACSNTSTTQRASGAGSGKTPVIFVHGFFSNGSMWSAAQTAFKAAGYTSGDITVFNYDYSQVGAAQAGQALATEVDFLIQKSGRPKVDIVAHSLGNLVTKACVVDGNCKDKVAHWANFAGAQNSTSIANLCTGPSCDDMKPGSALVTKLQGLDDAAMAAQGVKEQVHWSVNDGVILPPENSKEVYAENINVDSTSHLTISNDAGVLRDTIAFFAT
jgi:triacylglycerol lipase